MSRAQLDFPPVASRPLHAPAKAAATALLKSMASELAAAGVLELWLFGSVARGDDGPDSDVDIAIRVGKPLLESKFAAQAILRSRFERPVDVALLPLADRLRFMGAEEDLVRVL